MQQYGIDKQEEGDPGIAADARRLALEVIATLVNIKKNAAEQLL